jgi:hypothetical protein
VRDTLRRGSDTVPNPVGGGFDVVTLTPEVGYAFSRGFEARVRLPLHWKSFEETMPAVNADASGLGDLELLGQYQRAPAPHWRASVTAGATLPTGSTEAQPFVGQAAPTVLQLGSGTADPILAGLVRYQPYGRWSLSGNAATRLALYENAHAYQSANVFELGLGSSFSLWSGRVEARLHLDYSKVTHVEIAGARAPNTGRVTIFVSPGVRVRLWRDLSADVSARVPLYLRVNETQLTEDALLGVRLSYRTPPLF